jgi:hypothetical protein
MRLLLMALLAGKLLIAWSYIYTRTYTSLAIPIGVGLTNMIIISSSKKRNGSEN